MLKIVGVTLDRDRTRSQDVVEVLLKDSEDDYLGPSVIVRVRGTEGATELNVSAMALAERLVLRDSPFELALCTAAEGLIKAEDASIEARSRAVDAREALRSCLKWGKVTASAN